MDEKKEKRVLNIELDDDVKKVSITGLGDDETVVMKEELSEEELDLATGGTFRPEIFHPHIDFDDDDLTDAPSQICSKDLHFPDEGTPTQGPCKVHFSSCVIATLPKEFL